MVFAPPAHGDFEIGVSASDAARTPNVVSRTLRIRIGDGGVDETPPQLAPTEPGPLECGVTAAIGVLATDDAGGVEHVTVRGAGFVGRAFGPDRIHPLSLVVTATAPVPGPPGVPMAFDAEAEDTLGNRATASFSREVVDTAPPVLALAQASGPFAPGAPLDLTIFGDEVCGLIDLLRVDFGGITATTAVGQRALAGLVSIDAPEAVCVWEPVVARVELIDRAGLVSNGATLALAGTDAIAPRISVNTIVSGGGIEPGGTLLADVVIEDGQTPVHSATVTVSPIGVSLPDPLLSSSALFPSAACADRVPRALPIEIPIPRSLRFSAGAAALRIVVDAEDAAGNRASSSVDVPIVDLAPPALQIVSPRPGAVVLPGETVPIVVEAADQNQDVASLTMTVIGPASIDVAGVATATRAVQAATATVTFDLLVDAAPPLLGVQIGLGALAVDSGGTSTTAAVTVTLCGAPSVAAAVPSEGPTVGDTDVRIYGSGFAPTASIEIAGIPLSNQQVDSATAARGRIPAGSYAPGPADVTVVNDCFLATPSGTLPGGYRFDSPPSARSVPTANAVTALAGEGRGISPSTAALRATLGAGVLDGALAFRDGPLLLSSLAGSSTTGLAVVRFEAGASTDVSLQVELTSLDPTIVRVDGLSLTGQTPGDTVVIAALDGSTASIAVRVRDRLDVPAGATRFVPSGQRFLGGSIDGTVVALPRSAGRWQLAIDAEALTIGSRGRIVSRDGTPIRIDGASAAR